MGNLVLTRKDGQGITLKLPDGDFIHLTHGGECYKTGQTRFVIDAPDDVDIVRDELLNRGYERSRRGRA